MTGFLSDGYIWQQILEFTLFLSFAPILEFLHLL
jgi:hypothetical protein